MLWCPPASVCVSVDRRTARGVCSDRGTGRECFPGVSVVKNLPASAADSSSIPRSGRSPREGNDNPLQYSCLENSMARGAWWATVHGVTKNQTRLSDSTTTATAGCERREGEWGRQMWDIRRAVCVFFSFFPFFLNSFLYPCLPSFFPSFFFFFQTGKGWCLWWTIKANLPRILELRPHVMKFSHTLFFAC